MTFRVVGVQFIAFDIQPADGRNELRSYIDLFVPFVLLCGYIIPSQSFAANHSAIALPARARCSGFVKP